MRRLSIFGLTAVGATLLIVGLTAQARLTAETSLLGVRILTPVKEVLRRFGNPTMIASTLVQVRELGQGQQQLGGEQQGFFGGQPGMGGDFTMGTGQTRTETEMVYVYRVKGGSTYLFQANKDGRVVQISAYGVKPDAKVRTSRGITFGDTYAKVINQYGYPDAHVSSGNVIAIRYNKLGVAFQFDTKTNKVTGIFVAAGIPTTGPGFTALTGAGEGQQQGQFGPPGGMGGPPPGFFGGPPAPGGMPSPGAAPAPPSAAPPAGGGPRGRGGVAI